jgi:hypothetical protein
MSNKFQFVPQEAFKAQRRYDVQRPIIFTMREIVGVHVRTACEGRLDYLDKACAHPTTSITSDRITLRILVCKATVLSCRSTLIFLFF